MVDVQVRFSIICADRSRREWTHEFNVQKGCTVRKIKEIMLLPEGSKEDSYKFELRRASRRVPDYEQIWRPCAFDFGYLGVELGWKRASLDNAREAGTADAELALGGWWLCLLEGQGNQPGPQLKMHILHQLGSSRFTGEVVGLGSLEGRIDGKDISYEHGPYKIQGRVGDLGRTMLDCRSRMDGKAAAAFEARRIFDDDCWARHPSYDLRGRGDVEQMAAGDLEAVKRRVERMGYAGFSLFQGTAFLKKGGKPLYQEDLDYCGDESPVEFHLFTPPDPYEESSAEVNVPGPEQPAQQERLQERPQEQRSGPAAQEVEVVVRHAMKEMASQLTVKVPGDASMLDVRQAVLAALGETKLSEVKLVRRSGQGFQALEDKQRLGERRELLAMGRKLVAKAAPAPQTPVTAVPLSAMAATASAPAGAAAAAPPAQAPPAGLRPPAAALGAAGTAAAPLVEDLAVRLTSEDDEEAELEFSVQGTCTAQQLVDRILGGSGRGRIGEGVRLFIYDEFLDMVDRTLVGEDLLSSLGKIERRNLRLGGVPLPAAVPPEVTPAARAAKAPEDTQAAESAKAAKAVADARAAANVAKAAATGSAASAGVAAVRASSMLVPHIPIPAKEPPRPAEMTVTVVVDRELDVMMPLKVKQGSTIGELKAQLAAQDATGQARPGDFALVVPGQAGAQPLADAARLTEAHLELELVQ